MATIRMALRDDFDDPSSLQTYLAQQLMLGRLALFLGAGVSRPFGLPTWEGLLDQLYQSKGQTRPVGHTLERQAEHFRVTYYPGNVPGFIDAVRTALYQGVTIDFATLRKNDTIAALGALVMSSRRGAASAVVTFNYDDLLETYLDYHGFVTHSIIGSRSWSSSADVAVLHPHGFIPFDNSKPATDKIIFDQASFATSINDPMDVWRQRLLTILRTHTCIFVGIGGTDWNLDTLLVKAKDEHPSLNEQSAFWGITLTKSVDPVDLAIWEQRGVYPRNIKNYDKDLPDILFGIAQRAAQIRNAGP